MIVPSHFGPDAGVEEDFDVVAVGAQQPSPTYSSRWGFWNCVCQSVNQLNADFTLFYDTSLDSIRAIRRLRSQGYRTGFELCDFHSTYQTSPVKKIAYGLSERILPGQVDLAVVITHHITDWVKSVSPQQRVVLVPGLFDTTKFHRSQDAANTFRNKHSIAEGEVVVTYAGSWWKQKGVVEFVRAFEYARTLTDVPLKLVVAGKFSGNTELEDDIRQVIADRGLQECAILPGFLDSAEMVGLLSGSDVVVSPSLDHPFNHAAFPTKVAEYAGIGCAVLATAVGDVPLYFKDGVNSVLCDPHSTESMADGIVRLAEDRSLRQKIGVAAKETAQQYFDFRKCGIRIDNEVRELLSKRKCA